MTAFDTDVLSDLLDGNQAYVRRFLATPEADRCLPIVVLEEQIRGRFEVIRRAQSGRVRLTLPRAYELFRETVEKAREFRLLPYTASADALVAQWKAARLRVGTRDLRIAATCIVLGATLVTRNARDYAQVPGLTLDLWT